MKVLVIDNYDSFVFNLARYFVRLGAETCVLRNDVFDMDDVRRLNPTHIVLSPGPCTPTTAGQCIDVVKHFRGKVPILGVCLGHQAIAQALGARIVRAENPMHGMSSPIKHDGEHLFAGCSEQMSVGRYHSLVVERYSLSKDLVVSSWSSEGEVMSFRCEKTHLYGLQFHPESVLTPEGEVLLRNFLQMSVSSF